MNSRFRFSSGAVTRPTVLGLTYSDSKNSDSVNRDRR